MKLATLSAKIREVKQFLKDSLHYNESILTKFLPFK